MFSLLKDYIITLPRILI